MLSRSSTRVLFTFSICTSTATEQDLAMAQKALRKRESVDNSAVKMADRMQKAVTAKRSQVDAMATKISWYQDQLDNLVKVGYEIKA